jgi:hypothetical protein
MSYWKKLVKEKALSSMGAVTGYLGKSWDDMDKEDLINVIHIVYAENKKLREENRRLDVDAFQKEIKKA